MKIKCIIASLLFVLPAAAQTNEVLLETTEGNIRVMLYDDTPLHRDNFLKLVDEQFYDSLLFHRVIRNFMIQAGDRVAVGVSGGKDSMVLLLALNCLRQYYPEPFELEAVTIELGFEGMDFTPVRELCEKLDIPYTCVKTDIKEIVFDVRKEDNPCSLCAKMRRGALNNVLRERNLNKLALGHHFDDAVETYMMSLLFEGRISCFQPVTFLDRSGVTQIRPLIYAGEQKITNLARELNVPIVENPCPEDKGSKRYEIKQLLKTMSVQYPDMKSKIFGAMQRLPLKGWGKIER